MYLCGWRSNVDVKMLFVPTVTAVTAAHTNAPNRGSRVQRCTGLLPEASGSCSVFSFATLFVFAHNFWV